MKKTPLTAFLFCVCLGFLSLFSSDAAAKVAVNTFETPKLALKVWHNEDHTVPVVSLVVSFRAGGCYAPKTKAGIASMLADMLLEGAGDLPTQEFHERLSDLGIEISAHADPDRITFVMRSPREHLTEALTLFRLVLHKPRFDHDAFERVKKLALASVANQSQTPAWIASYNLSQTLYGPHPYSLPLDGTSESLETINVRDMGKFMKDHFSLDRVRLAASGDITTIELGQALDVLLKDLSQKGFRQKLSRIKLPEKGSVHHQKTPHPQATVLFAHKGIPHSHEDFMKYYLINYVLGGGGESKLMDEIRDKAGLAYHASTSEKNYRYVSLLSGALGTKGVSAHQAIEKVKEIFTRLRDKGLTQKELDLAKKHLIGRFPMSFTSSKQIAQVFHFYQIIGFQPDYLEKREALIRALTLKEVNAFARKFFNPDSLVFSVAGDVPDASIAPDAQTASSLKTQAPKPTQQNK